MENLKSILYDYLYFVIIFAIFLVILFIFLLVISKRSTKSSVYLSGLLMNLKNNEILALSIILINYLLLVYTFVANIDFNLTTGLIYIFLIILSFIILKSAKYIVVNGLINAVNVSFIYLGNLVNVLKHNNSGDIKYLILQILTMIFGVLFYTFTTCKFINNIRKKEKA